MVGILNWLPYGNNNVWTNLLTRRWYSSGIGTSAVAAVTGVVHEHWFHAFLECAFIAVDDVAHQDIDQGVFHQREKYKDGAAGHEDIDSLFNITNEQKTNQSTVEIFFSDGLAFCSHRAAADWSLRTSQANPNCRIDFVGPSGSSLLCRSFINCQNQWDARALTREFSPCFFTLISSTRSDPWIYLFFLFSVWTFNFFPTLFPSFPDIDRKNKRTRETKQSFREAFYLESWWSVASDLVPFFSRRMAFPWPIFLGQLGECALCILTDECLCL